MAALKLRVLYFGIVRERIGLSEEALDLPVGADVGVLLAELTRRHDVFALGAGSLRVAVNEDYVDEKHGLADGDEVAIIPPVAGGTSMSLNAMTTEAIDLGALVAAVADDEAGATATFLGTTRRTNRGRLVLKLEYEAYDGMALAEFNKMTAEATERWELCKAAVVHRTGEVPLGEASVAIAVSAPHRAESIEACHFLIDRLKEVAPIWKKEHFEGGEVWIGSLADCLHDHAEDPGKD